MSDETKTQAGPTVANDKQQTATCIGFGEHEARCDRPADMALNPSGLWCTRCEEARRAHITAQMAVVTKGFEDAGAVR